MTKKKIEQGVFQRKITYRQVDWKTLADKRKIAIDILSIFSHVYAAVYGSIARGDVTLTSDIDIIIFDVIPSYQVENFVDNLGLKVLHRSIVMATPNHAIKGHITLENDITISLPLVSFNQREREFYIFGGNIRLEELKTDKRVVGVDKRLMLIEPLEDGHVERPVMHVPMKELLALGFPQRLIDERIRVLKRRDRVGRTGVFLDHEVNNNEGFELTLKLLKDRNPLIRKKIEDSQ